MKYRSLMPLAVIASLVNNPSANATNNQISNQHPTSGIESSITGSCEPRRGGFPLRFSMAYHSGNSYYVEAPYKANINIQEVISGIALNFGRIEIYGNLGLSGLVKNDLSGEAESIPFTATTTNAQSQDLGFRVSLLENGRFCFSAGVGYNSLHSEPNTVIIPITLSSSLNIQNLSIPLNVPYNATLQTTGQNTVRNGYISFGFSYKASGRLIIDIGGEASVGRLEVNVDNATLERDGLPADLESLTAAESETANGLIEQLESTVESAVGITRTIGGINGSTGATIIFSRRNPTLTGNLSAIFGREKGFSAGFSIAR